jgi:hypothetical protein
MDSTIYFEINRCAHDPSTHAPLVIVTSSWPQMAPWLLARIAVRSLLLRLANGSTGCKARGGEFSRMKASERVPAQILHSGDQYKFPEPQFEPTDWLTLNGECCQLLLHGGAEYFSPYRLFSARI